MDLSSLAVSGTSKLIIKHPSTGADTDIVIELCGKDSDEYRAAYAAMLKVLHSNTDNKNIDFAKLDAETYAACTVSWENLHLDGEKLKCTPKNVKKVYNDKRLRWLHEQVITFVGNRENFMQPS